MLDAAVVRTGHPKRINWATPQVLLGTLILAALAFAPQTLELTPPDVLVDTPQELAELFR